MTTSMDRNNDIEGNNDTEGPNDGKDLWGSMGPQRWALEAERRNNKKCSDMHLKELVPYIPQWLQHALHTLPCLPHRLLRRVLGVA